MTNTVVAQSGTWLRRHPLIGYFALAYAISWPLWLLSRLAEGTTGTVLIVIGGFGPMLAAAIMIRYTGGSLSEWLRAAIRWRVRVRYYAYALGLPLLIMAAMNLGLAALGEQPELSMLPERIPAYLQTFLLTLVIFGGQEEPGWRGFALPRLELAALPTGCDPDLGSGLGRVAHPAVRAARLCRAACVGLLLHMALQQDRSVLLCILLHASFTPAQDHLLLTADSATVDAMLLGTYLAAAGVLIAMTRGRLGYRDSAHPAHEGG